MADDSVAEPDRARALRQSVKDGSAYAVMTGAGESYLVAYAIQLRFTEPQIAMLAAIPPLVGSLAQLVSSWAQRRLGIARRRLIVAGALGQALIWLPILFLPALPPAAVVPALIACVVAYHGFGNAISPHWPTLMRPLVPARERGRYFSRRTRIITLVTFAALVGGGAVLEWARARGEATAGFVALFLLAAGARLVSAYYLHALPDHTAHAPDPAAARLPLVPLWRPAHRHTPYARFLFYYAGVSFATALSAPFFAVHMLRDLDFSYLQFMAVTAASVLAQFLTLNGWGRVSDAFGNRLILVMTGWMIPFVPLLWMLTDDVYLLLLVQAFSGLAWGGFSLSAGSFLYDLSSDSDMAAPVATANLANAVAAFGGAHLGAAAILWMPDWAHSDLAWSFEYPLLGIFLLSFLARLVVVVTFVPVLREVRTVRRASARRVMFRFTRFSAFSGVTFDIASFLRPDDRLGRDRRRRDRH